MKKDLTSQENFVKEDPLLEALGIQNLEAKSVNKERSISELEELQQIGKKFLVEKRQLLKTLDQWQSEFNRITDKKCDLLADIEKNPLPQEQKSESESDYELFSVVTWGPSKDGFVFTVMAENEVWAEELVREWLNSNGRENHKIDKVMALVSRDVRAIVNVGAKLLDV